MFKTKYDDWEKWEQFLQAPLEDFSKNFPLKSSEKVIYQQVNKLTELIVGSAASFIKKPDKESYHLKNSYRSISLSNILCKIYERIILQEATKPLEKNNFFKGKSLYAYLKAQMSRRLHWFWKNKCARGLQVVNMAFQFLLICRVLLMQCGWRGHYISWTKQVSITIFSQPFPTFSLTDSIETFTSYTSFTLTPVTRLAPPLVHLRYFFSALLYSWFLLLIRL